MEGSTKLEQSDQSISKNINFFQNNFDSYNNKVQTLDSYVFIRKAINEAIHGIEHLLDIGNGGVFDYDTRLATKISALDLFLDKLPENFSCPPNVILKTGSALNIPEKDKVFDGVLMVMLIHHLVGTTVSECLHNLELSIKEASRVLKPGGKLIIVESCVPAWFYHFETLIYPIASRIINKTLEHPATLQYTSSLITKAIEKYLENVKILNIPLGRWIIHFGFKFPRILSPIQAKIFIAHKRR